MRIGLPLFVLLALAPRADGALAQSAGQQVSAALTAHLDSASRAYRAAANVVGLSVAVIRGRDTLLVGNYGSADLEHDIPVAPGTVFALGSTTKQFTAVAIHQLAEQGRIDLDADVRTYLPELDTHGATIPIWRLLDHTSGLAEYTGLPAFGAVSVQNLPRDTIIRLISHEPLVYQPGSRMIYSNTGFFLAATIVARVSGQSFESWLADHIFTPLAMTDSRYCDDEAIIPNRARGYAIGGGGVHRNAGWVNHRWPYGAGSVCGSARDLVRWNQALHHGRVLGAEEYRKLITPRPLSDGMLTRYSGGLAVHNAYGRRTIEHGGAITGFFSMAYFYPDQDLVIVVTQNTQGPHPARLADALADLVLGPPKIAATTATPVLEGLAGTYVGLRRGGVMKVVVTADSVLRLSLPGDSTPAAPAFRSGTTWEAGTRRFTFVRRGAGPPELRVELLWRPGDIYSHYVLTRDPN